MALSRFRTNLAEAVSAGLSTRARERRPVIKVGTLLDPAVMEADVQRPPGCGSGALKRCHKGMNVVVTPSRGQIEKLVGMCKPYIPAASARGLI